MIFDKQTIYYSEELCYYLHYYYFMKQSFRIPYKHNFGKYKDIEYYNHFYYLTIR